MNLVEVLTAWQEVMADDGLVLAASTGAISFSSQNQQLPRKFHPLPIFKVCKNGRKGPFACLLL